jgi:2,4-dienoyl-CoA reductase-like NADH-dependent reductase (Old Yellow Enzyme family)/thioredoxin reductase
LQLSDSKEKEKSMFEHLFQPITINGMVLKNRIVAVPTGDVFEEKAMGGAALVVAGHAIVEPNKSSFASADEPWIFEKYQREETHERVMKIHRGGAKASIEIFHGGAEARVTGYAKGPSDRVAADGTIVKAMTEKDMNETLEWYSKTAKGAVKAGFDSIFLHFGHGWLPAQFLSPFYNKRTDKYGGSLENRARFPLRILKTVREAVGPRFPVDMRISAYEWIDESISFEDVIAFLKMAEKYIDVVQISAGMDKNTFANVHCITTNLEEYMPNLKYAKEVKKVLQIPVSVVSAVMTPQMADEAIAAGYIDLAGFGRSLIADPDWPRKAMENHPEDIVPCLRCSNCYHIATDHWNVGCSVNPHFHHEGYVPKNPGKAEHVKNVLVVGGGPAGMKAAITACDRGHHVTLAEASNELGGMLKYIAKENHKDEVDRLLQYFRCQVQKRKINVMLNTSVTADFVIKMNPDALIIAVGAVERKLPIPGLDHQHVVMATEAINYPERVGENVVILGGGSIGCELALEFSEKGKNVSLIEVTDKLAGNANSLYREALRQKLTQQKNVYFYTKSSCKEVSDTEVIYEDAEKRQHSLPYDTMILSTGLISRADTVKNLFGIVRDTVAIGDCNRPANIMTAVFEGYSAALNI